MKNDFPSNVSKLKTDWTEICWTVPMILVFHSFHFPAGYRQVALNGRGTKSLFPAALFVHVKIEWRTNDFGNIFIHVEQFIFDKI